MKFRAAFIAVSALVLSSACDKSESPAGQAAESKSTSKVTEAALTANQVAPAAAEEAPEACAGKAEHEGGNCGQMAEEGGEGKGCNQWDEAAEKVAQREAPADSEWATLKVSGMTCGGCERRVIANLGGLEGVLAVEADAELGQVRVAVAKGNSTAKDAASAKIGELGYKVE